MTPDRLSTCLNVLRWPAETLAATLECDEALVENWLLGLEEIPMKAGAWIEALTQAHAAAESLKPVPVRGKRHKIGRE